MIALRAYLDSSGKLEDNWMTLAAIAAPDEIWAELEAAWDKILQGHTPKGSYIHMKEVIRLEKAFNSNLGWTHDNAFGLVNKVPDVHVESSQRQGANVLLFHRSCCVAEVESRNLANA